MAEEDTKKFSQETNKAKTLVNSQRHFYLGHISSLSYVHKKAERLTTALHLVTKFIAPNEAIRDRLRAESVGLLSDMFYVDSDSFLNEEWLDTITAKAAKIVALLEVAYRSGYVSEMNWNILSREYTQFPSLLKETRDADGIGALNKSFFHVEAPPPAVGEDVAQTAYDEAKPTRSIKDIKRTVSPGRKANIGQSLGSQKKKDDRRTAILGLLKHQDKISVKDVTAVVKGYSEKTLQRELLSLVSDGVLKKEGERRWSTYSLA